MDIDLSKKLQKNKLLEYFESLPPSHKNEYLKWINSAKKQETKVKRIDRMIETLTKKKH